ncbi:hypothetical protein J8273_2526 [Carpediemonas membranifera]|uniref:Uncharacterized protein n=1 Tax=Carpediemonas membranifera TaxID=201153 RepID=A0A8J6E1C4_9EUKA|nr:hypothetical protein J8273_2526 [Carpediemonas membranifera]|eukprot:KAG9396174.1 hypothetical protein J8273_2526 [Carpediemonas membranifera]
MQQTLFALLALFLAAEAKITNVLGFPYRFGADTSTPAPEEDDTFARNARLVFVIAAAVIATPLILVALWTCGNRAVKKGKRLHAHLSRMPENIEYPMSSEAELNDTAI